jgi:hypothetical protein
MDFTLVIDGKSFPIAKRCLLDFFEIHPCVFDQSSYQVQSPVSVEHFVQFVAYLKSNQLPDIAPANAKHFYSLSCEFGVHELISRFSHVVGDLRTVDSPQHAFEGDLKTNILSQCDII